METNYLLPNKYKKLGWILFILGILGGVFIYVIGFDPTEYLKMNVLSF